MREEHGTRATHACLAVNDESDALARQVARAGHLRKTHAPLGSRHERRTLARLRSAL